MGRRSHVTWHVRCRREGHQTSFRRKTGLPSSSLMVPKLGIITSERGRDLDGFLEVVDDRLRPGRGELLSMRLLLQTELSPSSCFSHRVFAPSLYSVAIFSGFCSSSRPLSPSLPLTSNSCQRTRDPRGRVCPRAPLSRSTPKPALRSADPSVPNWKDYGRIQGFFCGQDSPSRAPPSSPSPLWSFGTDRVGLQGLTAAGENSCVRYVAVSRFRMLTSPVLFRRHWQ